MHVMIFCVIESFCGVLGSARRTASPSVLCQAIKAVCLDTDANTLVEYAMVLSLLSVVMLSGMTAIGSAASNALSTVESEMLNYGMRNGL